MENATVIEQDAAATDWETIFKVIYNVVGLIVGVSGNGLILGVYRSKTRKTSTTVLIMGLAWNDLAISLLRVRSIGINISVLAGTKAHPLFLFLQLIEAVFQGSAILITSAIAVDRFDCVFWPLKRRQLITRRARRILVCSFLVPIVLSIIPIMATMYPSQNMKMVVLGLQIAWYITALSFTVVCYGGVYCYLRRRAGVGIAPLNEQQGPHRKKLAEKRSVGTTKQKVASVSQATAGPSAMFAEPVSKGLKKNKPHGTCLNVPVGTRSSSSPTTRGIITVKPAVLGRERPHQTILPVPVRDRQENVLAKQRTAGVQDQTSQGVSSSENAPSRAAGRMTSIMQRKITRMMFVTSIVFLLTWLPYVLYAVLELHRLNGGTVDDGLVTGARGLTALVYVNNVANPFIYSLVNMQFRRDCFDMIRKMRCWCGD